MTNANPNTLHLPLASVRALAVRNRDLGDIDTLDNVLVVVGEPEDFLTLDPQDGWTGPEAGVIEGFVLYRHGALTIAVSIGVNVTGINEDD